MALSALTFNLLAYLSSSDWKKHFPAFLEACKQAGVRHFVKLSFYHAQKADQFADIPLVRDHGECDAMLMDMIKPSVDANMEGDTDVTIDYAKPHSKSISIFIHFMIPARDNAFSFSVVPV